MSSRFEYGVQGFGVNITVSPSHGFMFDIHLQIPSGPK